VQREGDREQLTGNNNYYMTCTMNKKGKKGKDVDLYSASHMYRTPLTRIRVTEN